MSSRHAVGPVHLLSLLLQKVLLLLLGKISLLHGHPHVLCLVRGSLTLHVHLHLSLRDTHRHSRHVAVRHIALHTLPWVRATLHPHVGMELAVLTGDLAVSTVRSTIALLADLRHSRMARHLTWSSHSLL